MVGKALAARENLIFSLSLIVCGTSHGLLKLSRNKIIPLHPILLVLVSESISKVTLPYLTVPLDGQYCGYLCNVIRQIPVNNLAEK